MRQVRVGGARRRAACALALTGLLAGLAQADKLQLTTTYPAPSGAYDTLYSKQYRFNSFDLRSDMNNPPMPGPGTFVYCKETDAYYASNGSADPNDSSTWWYRIQLDDTPEDIFAEGSKDEYHMPNNTYAWVHPPDVLVGKLYYYNIFIKSKIKIVSAGSYTATATGSVCEVRPSGSTTFAGPNAYGFKLALRLNGTYVATSSGFTLAAAANQDSDCGMDATNDLLYPATVTPVCYCAPFSLSGQLALPVGNYPYIGLLSYGTHYTVTWNNKATWGGYGGYVVHLDDMKISK